MTSNLKKENWQAVVIGASSGGIKALGKILPALPASYSIPIIIVIHLPDDKPSLLTGVFRNKVKLKVKEADEKEEIVGGTIYFAPPGYHLLVEKNKTFSLSNEKAVLFSRPSIDVLFESAADTYGQGLVGILLTGANEDGALGLKKIKEAGGLTLIQNPASAEEKRMPNSGLPYVLFENILSLKKITNFLTKEMI
jgi:two-component system chemotaxis response regulator CheB